MNSTTNENTNKKPERKKRVRNKELNRQHQKKWVSNPENHAAVLEWHKQHYIKNKERISKRQKFAYIRRKLKAKLEPILMKAVMRY